MTNQTYVRIWHKTNNCWFYETYKSTDESWKEAFLILKNTGSPVKIQYLSNDKEADDGSPQKIDFSAYA